MRHRDITRAGRCIAVNTIIQPTMTCTAILSGRVAFRVSLFRATGQAIVFPCRRHLRAASRCQCLPATYCRLSLMKIESGDSARCKNAARRELMPSYRRLCALALPAAHGLYCHAGTPCRAVVSLLDGPADAPAYHRMRGPARLSSIIVNTTAYAATRIATATPKQKRRPLSLDDDAYRHHVNFWAKKKCLGRSATRRRLRCASFRRLSRRRF